MRASAVYIVKTNHLNVNQGGANCLPIILTPAHYDKVGGKVTREIDNAEKGGNNILLESLELLFCSQKNWPNIILSCLGIQNNV